MRFPYFHGKTVDVTPLQNRRLRELFELGRSLLAGWVGGGDQPEKRAAWIVDVRTALYAACVREVAIERVTFDAFFGASAGEDAKRSGFRERVLALERVLRNDAASH